MSVNGRVQILLDDITSLARVINQTGAGSVTVNVIGEQFEISIDGEYRTGFHLSHGKVEFLLLMVRDRMDLFLMDQMPEVAA